MNAQETEWVTRPYQHTVLLYITSAAQTSRNKSVRALNLSIKTDNPAHAEDRGPEVYYRKEAIPMITAQQHMSNVYFLSSLHKPSCVIWSESHGMEWQATAATDHCISSKDQQPAGFRTLMISHDVWKTPFSPSSLVFFKDMGSYTQHHVKRTLRFLISPLCLGGIFHCVLYTLHSIHRADSAQLKTMILPSLFKASQLPTQSSRPSSHTNKLTEECSTSLCVRHLKSWNTGDQNTVSSSKTVTNFASPTNWLLGQSVFIYCKCNSYCTQL